QRPGTRNFRGLLRAEPGRGDHHARLRQGLRPHVPGRGGSSQGSGTQGRRGRVNDDPVPAAGGADVAASTNLARALERVGILIGLTLLAELVVDGVVREAGSWQAALRWGAAYAAVGIVLLLATGALVSRVFLRGRMRAEIARGNVAAGLVAAADFVSVGWIMESCFFGRDLHSLTVSALFYLIGVATLILLQLLYRALTHYADDQEVVGENAAAALGFAGVTLALA